MICEICKNTFDYDEGIKQDNDTFICYQCLEERSNPKLETVDEIANYFDTLLLENYDHEKRIKKLEEKDDNKIKNIKRF